MIKRIKNWPGRMKFLIAVLCLYAIIFFAKKDIFEESIKNFWQMLSNVVPILLVVFVAIMAINLFIQPDKIRKHLGHGSGLKGWLYALLGGLVISAPPYILLPMLGDLKKHGMRTSLIVAFLYNRNIQLTFLPAMIFYFGLIYTIILAAYMLIFAIISGMVLEKLLEK